MLALAPGLVAAPAVTLREGTNLSVSTDRTGRLLALDLAGSVWVLSRDDGWARRATEPGSGSQHSVLSPDGRRVAFEARRNGHVHIQLLDLDSGEQRQLTLGDFDHFSPAWHPDGQRVAMASGRGGNFAIWEVDIASLSLNQLTFAPGDEWEPAWNAAGTALAFVSATPAGEGLFVQRGGEPPRLVAEGTDRLHAPAWRPDDSLLTFVTRGPGYSRMQMAILSDPPVVKPVSRGENVVPRPARWLDRETFLYAADGRLRERSLDSFTPRDVPFSAEVSLPVPVPVGAQGLPVTPEARSARGITGLAAGEPGLFVTALGDLWQLDRLGQAPRQLTDDPFVESDPALAPDGRQLALVSDRSGSAEIWLLDLASGAWRALTDAGQIAMEPAWRTDGRALAFLSAAHSAATSANLLTVDPATREIRTVAAGLPFPSGPAWLPDGSLAVTVDGGSMLRVPAGDGPPAAVPLPDGTASARWSPDGRFLAVATEAGLELAGPVAAGEAPGPFRRVATGPVHLLRWAADSEALLYSDGAALWQLNMAADAGPPAGLAVDLQWRPASAGASLVVRAGRLFDGLGPEYATNQDIEIRDGRIVALRPAGDGDPSLPVWDARSHVVLPGLIDASVRPAMPAGERLGRTLLGFGITTIRETLGPRPNDSLEREESWAAGRRPGPRVLKTLPACPDSPETAGSLTAQARRIGAGTLEICAGLAGPVQVALAAGARDAGLSLSSRSPFPAALLGASEIGLFAPAGDAGRHASLPDRFAYGDIIEIAGALGLVSPSRLSGAGLPDLAARSAIADVPAYARLFGDSERYWYAESWRRQSEAWGSGLRAERRAAGQSLFRAMARGVRVIPGSDAPESPWGLGLHAELRLLAETGLQPFQVLRMATLDAARALGAADTVGRVAPGQMADLVIVDGDPLGDIEDAARIVAVLVGGRVYTAQTLRESSDVEKIYTPAEAEVANPRP